MVICGLDEAGRGPLAGPLVAAAVVLNKPVAGLNDSKKLKSEIRNGLFDKIIKSGATVQTEVFSVRQINNRGMGWANKEIFRKLIKRIQADKYIVDGNLKLGRLKNKNIKCIIKADTTRKCVMAASIVAKVTRDRMMQDLHNEFPQYGWNMNMGYGTSGHITAIREYGTVRHHRDIYVTTALKQ